MTISPPAARPRSSPWRFLFWLLGLLLAAVVLWRFTPLHAYANPKSLAALGRAVREHPAAPLIVLLAYLAGALTLFPVTWLVIATTLIFEPLHAFVLAIAGVVEAGAVTFGIGRLVARHRPEWLEGPRLSRLRARVQKRGVAAVISSRLMPIGNFSLYNIVAGALGIPFRDFMLGNALGVLPLLTLLTIFAGTARRLGWGIP
jgi:phospholipase D1/2